MSHKSWTFTLNNYDDEHIKYLRDNWINLCSVLFASKEIGESGTPHLQGYFTLKKSKRLTDLKKYLGNQYHFESAKGNKDQNSAYIFKSGSEPLIQHDHGGSGRRTDIEQFYSDYTTLGKRKAIENNISTAVKYYKGLEYVISELSALPPRSDYPTVYWLFGPTGIGKTEFAFQGPPESPALTPPAHQGGEGWGRRGTYICDNYPWFDGYTNQDVVVFDEYDKEGGKLNFRHLLRYLDKYPVRVPVKGSTVEFNPDYIVITSSVHPEHIFPQGDWEQVERRLTHIMYRQKYEDEWTYLK